MKSECAWVSDGAWKVRADQCLWRVAAGTWGSALVMDSGIQPAIVATAAVVVVLGGPGVDFAGGLFLLFLGSPDSRPFSIHLTSRPLETAVESGVGSSLYHIDGRAEALDSIALHWACC